MAEPKKVTEAAMYQVRVDRAYKAVLGVDHDSRSTAQQLVWEDMQARGFFRKGTHVLTKTGEVSKTHGIINEGKRLYFLGTLGRIESVPAMTIPD